MSAPFIGSSKNKSHPSLSPSFFIYAMSRPSFADIMAKMEQMENQSNSATFVGLAANPEDQSRLDELAAGLTRALEGSDSEKEDKEDKGENDNDKAKIQDEDVKKAWKNIVGNMWATEKKHWRGCGKPHDDHNYLDLKIIDKFIWGSEYVTDSEVSETDSEDERRRSDNNPEDSEASDNDEEKK